MGILYYGKLQIHRAAEPPHLREGWDTLATFEFGKDYVLSAAVEHAQATPELQEEIGEDMRFIACLNPGQVLDVIDNLGADASLALRLVYSAMTDAADSQSAWAAGQHNTRLILYSE